MWTFLPIAPEPAARIADELDGLVRALNPADYWKGTPARDRLETSLEVARVRDFQRREFLFSVDAGECRENLEVMISQFYVTAWS